MIKKPNMKISQIPRFIVVMPACILVSSLPVRGCPKLARSEQRFTPLCRADIGYCQYADDACLFKYSGMSNTQIRVQYRWSRAQKDNLYWKGKPGRNDGIKNTK